MLGFRFVPRFRDLDDQRFWRADPPEEGGPPDGYGPLEAVACNKVNLKRTATHWSFMLRVAGSLITNQVRAYDLLRMFGREGHPTPLGAAFAEYGRIDKVMHLLGLVLNAVVLWNTRYLDAAVAQLRAEGARHQGRGRGPLLPAQGPAHQLPGPLSVQHQGQRTRSGPAPDPGPGGCRGRRGLTAAHPARHRPGRRHAAPPQPGGCRSRSA
ncbi:Tn3 family transposase [Streptomyces mirabilis]